VAKLFITGATGFIGGFIVNHALDAGLEVYAAVRKSSNSQELLQKGVTCLPWDFENPTLVKEILKQYQFDYVIYNAGLTKHQSQDELNKVNAGYVKTFLDAALQANVQFKKFIYTSSLASYGPADGSEHGIIDSRMTPRPVTMYGVSKLKAEKIIESYDDLPYLIYRPTAVYGPKERDLLAVFKMINKGLEVKLGAKEQKLSFIYVEDLARLLIKGMLSSAVRKGYFVSDGNTYTSDQLNQYIKSYLNRKTISVTLPVGLLKVISKISESMGKITQSYPILNQDKLNELTAESWICDTAECFEDSDFVPEFPLDKGVPLTIDWYKHNNWL